MVSKMRRYFTKEPLFDEATALKIIRRNTQSLNAPGDLDPLMKRIGDARIVMLGEASHGTHEYYQWRSIISKRLIKEKHFDFIAVEGDWPDCYQLNRSLKGYLKSDDALAGVLRKFNRWPTWMWANWEIHALGEWLKKYNQALPANKRVGFYGLDVYSLWESMDSIMQYLKKNDEQALRTAEAAYACFEPFRKDEGQSYARASHFVPELCQDEVITLLREIQRKLPGYNTDHENVFNTEQNAYVALNAEKYYRAMIRGGPHSWNIRDRHMADTLKRLLDFHGPESKAIIWAHNTHIGDARATDMISEGMYNIGELARIEYPEDQVVLVGFGCYEGSVIASHSWGSVMKKMHVPPGLKQSWEYLLHNAGEGNKLLLMQDITEDIFMENHIGHRAIGVVYQPQFEQYGNYVPSLIPLRYDAFLFFHETEALHPLHIQPDGHLVPETYPFGV